MTNIRENGVPYQFWVDKKVHADAMAKIGPTGQDLASIMRMAVEQFVERPIDESMAMLEAHAKRHNKKKKKRSK